MESPLSPNDLAERLAEVYLTLGPIYRRVSRIVEHDEARMQMSVGVRAVLDQLRRDGELTVPRIAERQELSRQFVQRMVNDARDAGYVELVANPHHRRSSLVRLTPRGHAAIAAVIARELDLMGRVGGDITRSELEATLHVLTHMLEALHAVEVERRHRLDAL